jgi:hypothetical protein
MNKDEDDNNGDDILVTYRKILCSTNLVDDN